MPAHSRFTIAKKDIIEYFNNQDKVVFNKKDIAKILNDNTPIWRLPASMSVSSFVSELTNKTNLKKIEYKFPSRTTHKYIWGNPTDYEVITMSFPDDFFCHYTAMFLHNLTLQHPKKIYLKSELTYNVKNSKIEGQDSINRSFSNSPRRSNNFCKFHNKDLYRLYGKKLNNLGVIYLDTDFGRNLRVTDLERTLIDITIRPFYSGGIGEVIESFKLAQPNVSINKLVAYLKSMNYIYPYHQAIGFYLEKTGLYSKTQIELLEEIGISYDFYIDYKIVNPGYDKKWRLFIPNGF